MTGQASVMTLDGNVFYFTSSSITYTGFGSTSEGEKGIKGRFKGVMDDDMKEIITQYIMNNGIVHNQFCL
jgi:hypothetical protein